MAALSACAQEEARDPLYAHDQCRRVAILEADTRRPIIGAEDLAFDAEADRLIISAYDRRSVERAATSGAETIPEGDLYFVELSALAGDTEEMALQPVVERGSVAGGLRPHGISFDPATKQISVVNRVYDSAGGGWRMRPRIDRFGADGALTTVESPALHCSANDLTTLDGETLVSFDHAGCGWRAVLEDIAATRKSGLATLAGEELFVGARHANGVIATLDGDIALAATRDRAVLLLSANGGEFALTKKIHTPGGPDNLTLSDDGSIIAALHPSLMAIGAQRRLGVGKAGSRIVRIDLSSGRNVLLFDDPKAELFSAATAAIEVDGTLVAGSVLDAGLLVCKSGAP